MGKPRMIKAKKKNGYTSVVDDERAAAAAPPKTAQRKSKRTPKKTNKSVASQNDSKLRQAVEGGACWIKKERTFGRRRSMNDFLFLF